MTEEGYSLDKLRGAQTESMLSSLGVEGTKDREQLNAVDDALFTELHKLFVQWKKAKDRAYKAPNILIGVLHDFEAEYRSWKFNQRGGKDKLNQLRNASAKTVEGQVELAHQEGNFFMNALQIRAARLEQALASKDESAAARYEFRLANDRAREFLQALKKGDLKEFEHAIDFRRRNEEMSGPGEPQDVYTSAEHGTQVPLDTAPEVASQALARLTTSSDGQFAFQLFDYLLNPGTSAAEFQRSLDEYFTQHTLHQKEPAETDEQYQVIRREGNRWVQLTFFDSGLIELWGRP